MRVNERVAAYIDLDAAKYNIRNIRKRTDKRAEIIAVVKADAYGHGARQMAKVFIENGADALAVAVIEEAIELRNEGITQPILILGYTSTNNFEKLIQYDITQNVYCYDMACKLSETAQRLGKSVKVHIKIDTGMSRLGFLVNEKSLDEIEKISKLPYIDVEGIFTHFSKVDVPDKSFTLTQEEKFYYVINELEKRGIKFRKKHAANSAGIIDIDDVALTAVRPGIILYGSYPSEYVMKEKLALKPVMSLKSLVSFVKTVPEGTPVGYGCTFVTKRETVIATIPVGYADGYIRRLANGGRVLINGKYAPIIGRICMDQCMVDVTDIGDVKMGDEVVLMGKQGENEITCEELASILDTINYEVYCSISKRVPRVYIEDGEIKSIVKLV